LWEKDFETFAYTLLIFCLYSLLLQFFNVSYSHKMTWETQFVVSTANELMVQTDWVAV